MKDMVCVPTETFCGKGDVAAWLQKIKFVATLQDIDDLASFISLYLDGSALVLCQEMEEKDQLSTEKL